MLQVQLQPSIIPDSGNGLLQYGLGHIGFTLACQEFGQVAVSLFVVAVQLDNLLQHLDRFLRLVIEIVQAGERQQRLDVPRLISQNQAIF